MKILPVVQALIFCRSEFGEVLIYGWNLVIKWRKLMTELVTVSIEKYEGERTKVLKPPPECR